MSRVLLFTMLVLATGMLFLTGCGEDTRSTTSPPPGTVTFRVFIYPQTIESTWELSGPNGYLYQGENNETVSEILAGLYTITFNDVDGMVTPAPVTRLINGSGSTRVDGFYISQPEQPRELNMIEITGGQYESGSPEDEPFSSDNERPQHLVTVSSFMASDTEITQAQFLEIMGFVNDATDCNDCATATATFQNAIQYCNALSYLEGLDLAYDNSSGSWVLDLNSNGYRLPTEAEWEYMCRAGSTEALTNGELSVCCNEYDENMDAVAWYGFHGLTESHRVAAKQANAFGLFDLHGNVREWCWDWYGDYSADELTNPTGPASGTNRVVRGGSWNNGANLCRSATRLGLSPNTMDYETGFRIVQSIIDSK